MDLGAGHVGLLASGTVLAGDAGADGAGHFFAQVPNLPAFDRVRSCTPQHWQSGRPLGLVTAVPRQVARQTLQ